MSEHSLNKRFSFSSTVTLVSSLLLGESVVTKPRLLNLHQSFPLIRIEAQGFNVSKEDIRAVISSAGRELWQFFPNYALEPIVLKYGKGSPIVFFNRNHNREIVMQLSSRETYWSQYSYQFAHEFCHVLCGFDNDAKDNMWFEETICETASLFVMKRMAQTWAITPPYRNWRNYSSSLNQYVNDIITKSEKNTKLDFNNLADFYQKHKSVLKNHAEKRDINRSMSLVLLKLFEQTPNHWEAVRWLNSAPSLPGETFSQYIKKWFQAVPLRHQDFIKKISILYGVKIN